MKEPSANNSGKKILCQVVKWVSIVAASLVVIGLIVYITLAFYLDTYLKSTLEKKVRQSSDGLYSLDIGSLHFNIYQFSLAANNLTFSTDTLLYQKLRKEEKEPGYYQLSAKGLFISHIQVWPLLWGRGIQVPEIVLASPAVYIHSQPGNKQNTGTGKKPLLTDIHQHIEKYISWLTVDSVAVHNGQLQYVLQGDSGKTIWEMQEFSLLLQDVLIDEGSYKDTTRLFYTKNIALIANEGIRVTSKPYSFTTRFLSVSTANGTEIHHVAIGTDTTRTDAENTRLDIHIPSVHIGYLDWRKLLDKEGLYIPAIYIKQPEAKISINNLNSGKQPGQPWLKLHTAINQLLPWLQVDSIRLDSGNVRIEIANASRNKHFAVKNFNLKLNDVLIDSGAAHSPDRILYTKDIQLTIPDFVQVITELYAVKATLISASTSHGVYLEGVTVQTDKAALQQQPQATVYELTVPSLQVDFTDWGTLLKNKGLHIPSIRISRPEGSIMVSDREKSNGKAQPLHKMLPSFIPWLQIDQLVVEEGHLTYVQAIKNGGTSFTIDHFILSGKDILISPDAASDSSRFLYTREISFEVKDYIQVLSKQHKLRIGHLSASTSKGITLQQVNFHTDTTRNSVNNKLIYNITVPLIYTDFTSWSALSDKKGIQASLLQIEKPKVAIHSSAITSTAANFQKQEDFPQKNLLALHQEISPYIPWLQIDAVQLTHGEARFVQESHSGETIYSAGNIHIGLDNLLIDSATANDRNRIFYAQDFRLEVKDSLSVNSPVYTFVLDSLLVSTKSGMQAKAIRFFPQSGMLDKTRKQVFFEITIPAFSSTFTDWGSFMQAAGVYVPDIQIEEPRLTVIAPNQTPNQRTRDTDLSFVRTMITSYVPRLTIDSIHLNKGAFFYTQYPNQRENMPYSAEDINITLDAIQIDTSIGQTNTGLLYAEDIRFKVKDFHQLFKDSLYALSAEKIEGSTRNKNLQVINLALQERYPPEEFFRRAGRQRDIIRFNMQRMDIQNFHMQELIEHQKILADVIQADKPVLKIFRDRRVLPENPEQQKPLDAFREMDTYVQLDSIFLSNGYISYTEFAKKGQEPGEVFFDSINASLGNLTNDSTLVSLENPVSFQAKALLMGTGKTNLLFKAPIYNDSISFQYIGSIGEMDLTTLNPMLENVAFVKIKSGHLDELTTRARARHDQATGIMCAFYRNFEIELIPHDPSEDDALWTDVTTFLANKFIINTRNRRKNYNFNPGFIEIEPDKEKNTLNYFWDTIRSGIYSSVGYKQAKKILPFL